MDGRVVIGFTTAHAISVDRH